MFNMVSLDGFFEGPNQEIDWHVVDEEFNQLCLLTNSIRSIPYCLDGSPIC